MRVLPTAQHTLRQAGMEMAATAFPSAIRTLASIIASITIVITIYVGYRKCIRGRDGSFTSERNREQPYGIPLTSYEDSGAYSEDLLPVYVGDGRYIYVSRSEFPRDPPHIVRRELDIPARFDTSTLKQFEAANEERQHSCAICLEELKAEVVSAGQCLHLMHSSCLTSWLNKDINSNCPVCRVRIVESASFESLRGKVVEPRSLTQAASETNVDLPMDTGLSGQDDVRLAVSGEGGSIGGETEGAAQVTARGTTEGNAEVMSVNNSDEQAAVGDAMVLRTQDVLRTFAAVGEQEVVAARS